MALVYYEKTDAEMMANETLCRDALSRIKR